MAIIVINIKLTTTVSDISKSVNLPMDVVMDIVLHIIQELSDHIKVQEQL